MRSAPDGIPNAAAGLTEGARKLLRGDDSFGDRTSEDYAWGVVAASALAVTWIGWKSYPEEVERLNALEGTGKTFARKPFSYTPASV